METLTRGWQKIPQNIRKPIVLIIGMLFVIAAGLTGWLPGPGGIPLFLIGIAILSTEFAWARRLRDAVLKRIYSFGDWYKQHRIIGTILLLAGAICAIAIGALSFVFLW